MAAAAKKVCVTGPGGFVASWLVKLLLSKGYFLHGTVRQLVFHVAGPVPSTTVPNPEVEVIEPAVKGTTNVLNACLEAKVERVVFVSSQAAISLNPNFPKDKVMDESCWSDKEFCKETKNWYCFSKTEAELQALDFAKRTGLIVVVCESLENKHRWIVDVLAYEKLEAEGRYICTAHPIKTQDLVEKLKCIYPNYSYPANYIEVDDYTRLSSEKLQRLGWRYRPLEETLIDSVESYREAGLLESK